MTRRLRYKKPVFTNIRVTEEQAHWIKNRRHQYDEPIDSVIQRIIQRVVSYDKEHPEQAAKNVLHYADDRMSGLLIDTKPSDTEISYEWMRHITKYEKELNIEAGDNPYELISNLRMTLDSYYKKLQHIQ